MRLSSLAPFVKGALAELSLSTEEIATETGVSLEQEYVFFYKLTDLSQLFKASSIIEQEQYEIALPDQGEDKPRGWIRVRCEGEKGADQPAGESGDGKHYSLTLKVSTPGQHGREEFTLSATKEIFDGYKVLCASGMKKTRFCFPIQGTEGRGPNDGPLVWEIDVFDDPSTDGACPWVKVDLEFKGELGEMPAFPLSYSKRIVNQWDKRTPDEQEFIKQLYGNVYNQAAEPAAEEDGTQTEVGGQEQQAQPDTQVEGANANGAVA